MSERSDGLPRRIPSVAGVIAEAAALRDAGDADAIAQAITRLAVLLAADNRELLRVKDAADMLSVSEDTIRRATDSGELRVVRIGNTRTAVRIAREDLVAYVLALMEEQRRP